MHTPYHLIQSSLPRQRGRGPRPAALLPQSQQKIKKWHDSPFGLHSSHRRKGFSCGSARWQALVPVLPGLGGLPLGAVAQAARGAGPTTAPAPCRHRRQGQGEGILPGSCTLPLWVATPHTLPAGREATTTAPSKRLWNSTTTDWGTAGHHGQAAHPPCFQSQHS